jgi:predicted ATP-grasp superfamily ATP-dependent carboligase
METRTDIHVESAKIQNEIKNFLGLRSDEVMFEYANADGKTKLDLITINPRHNQSFLFKTINGFDKTDVLYKMLDYVRTHKDKESSFTIQWMMKGMNELQTSYFRAKNMYDAMDKLYYGRDMNNLTLFSIVLNPVA